MDHIETGRYGESLAERYFSGKGWTILGRNVRVRGGEIDLVAVDGEEMVVVEVRTRTIGKTLPAEESVGPRILRVLVRSGRILAAESMIHPPIDDPTSTTGPSTAWSMMASASSRHNASVCSSKLPGLCPQPP